MTLAEVADFLSIATGVDKRTIGEVDVRAWQLVLDDIAFPDAVTAMRAYYRENTRPVMPADIVQRIKPTPGYENYVEKGIF
jgi:hypothetical protein